MLVFGGGGFIGGNLAELAEGEGWRVSVAGPRRKSELRDVDWRIADIADEQTVDKIIQELMPTAVVNVAAIADIDRAEREKELAWSVNVVGAANVARSCARLGIKYVFISSDAVFDGERAAYSEEDASESVNYYGRTKAEAEKCVFRACSQAVVIRTSLVLGYPVAGGNSFLSSLERKLKTGNPIVCSIDEIRTPIDVITLCRAVFELAVSSFSGYLHIAGIQSVSRCELTRKLASKMGFEPSVVRALGPQMLGPDRAPRHRRGVLDVSKARQVLMTPLPDLDQTIDRALKRRPRYT